MADISSVDATTIKDLYERLEGLSCMVIPVYRLYQCMLTIYPSSSNHDESLVLSLQWKQPALAVPNGARQYVPCKQLFQFSSFHVFYVFLLIQQGYTLGGEKGKSKLDG